MARVADIAWAAGFVDGEGCFTIHRYARADRPHGTRHYPRITVQNLSRPALERLNNALGDVSKVLEITAPSRKSTRPMWEWRLDGAPRCADAVEALIPHLTIKKRQAIVIRALCVSLLSSARSGLSADEIAARDDLVTQIKLLNKGETA